MRQDLSSGHPFKVTVRSTKGVQDLRTYKHTTNGIVSEYCRSLATWQTCLDEIVELLPVGHVACLDQNRTQIPVFAHDHCLVHRVCPQERHRRVRVRRIRVGLSHRTQLVQTVVTGNMVTGFEKRIPFLVSTLYLASDVCRQHFVVRYAVVEGVTVREQQRVTAWLWIDLKANSNQL